MKCVIILYTSSTNRDSVRDKEECTDYDMIRMQLALASQTQTVFTTPNQGQILRKSQK